MIFTLLLLSAFAAPVAEAHGQPLCPGADAHARGMVVRFLTSPNTLAERQARGMAAVSPRDIRVLTDEQDAAVCRQFRDTIQLGQGRYPRTSTYYRANGFFFVATRSVVPPDRVYLGHAALLVFDSNLNFIDSYAQ